LDIGQERKDDMMTIEHGTLSLEEQKQTFKQWERIFCLSSLQVQRYEES